MSVKLKLSLLFTMLAGAILLLFALVIFFLSAVDRRNEFFGHLRKEAHTRANLLFNAGVDAQTLQTIYMSNREILSEVEVAIYDKDFNLIYHDAFDIDFVKETPEMIHTILQDGEIRFVQNRWEVIGISFQFNGERFAITAAAFDEYGYAKLSNLRTILLSGWFFGVLLIFGAGWFFSGRALFPVAQMTRKVNEISASHLDLRLNEGDGKDELAKLAATFNQMLDRLEDSFDAQKEFVSSIAHEMRTPLAAIIGEIELTLSQPRKENQYKESMEKALEDASRLSRLTSGILDLARASYDPSKISLRDIRIDEMLIDARGDLLKINPEYKINLQLNERLADDDLLTKKGNEYLIKVAFANVMENACKYSPDKRADVFVRQDQEKLVVSVIDKGAGIPSEEIELVFKPFYRGKNSRSADGTGIGLPLVQRILQLHHAEISIESEHEKGTTVTITWPN